MVAVLGCVLLLYFQMLVLKEGCTRVTMSKRGTLPPPPPPPPLPPPHNLVPRRLYGARYASLGESEINMCKELFYISVLPQFKISNLN